MSLDLLVEVLKVCKAPRWTPAKDAIDLIVERDFVSFDTLKKLEEENIFAENLSFPSAPKLQSDYDGGKVGQIPPEGQFRLKLPRIVNQCVVAEDLSDLLSIHSTTYRIPQTYLLISVDDSNTPYCYTGPDSLLMAPPQIRRYHDSISLWETIEEQAEHLATSTRNALFFGIRRTEIAPRFSIADLAHDIAVQEIQAFLGDADRPEIRKEIFRSVLSEFLRDQKPDRAFSYLLCQNFLFARRLNEGLAIYLSDHSSEKLVNEAQLKYLGLAETLERIVGGMEVKSLSIPAAVLLAVKEAEMGGKWNTLNVIIIIATALYVATMLIVFLGQRAALNLLSATITKTTKELKDQGLDERNPVLAVSFQKLKERLGHTQFAKWIMLVFSLVPLVAVLYAVFLASPPDRSNYSFQISPTRGVLIIQTTNSPSPLKGTP